LAYSADGSLLAGGSDDAVIRVWNNQGGLLQTMQAGRYEEVAGLGFIPGENRLISIHGTEALYLWDIESGERISEYHSDMGYGWAYSAVVSSDGKWVTVIDDDQMTIFSLEDGHFNEVKTLHQLTTYCAFSPDDNFLAAFTQSGVVNIYSVGDWALVRAINVPSDATRLAYAPDGNVLAVGTTAGKVALFNAKTGEPYSRQLLSAHDGIINSLSFSEDGAILVTASEDGSLTAWRMPEGEKIIQVTGFNAAPVFVYMLHDQPLLVYGGGYPTQLNLIDPRNGAVQSMTTLENNSTMAQYPLRDLLITADYDNISSWDPVTNDLKNSDMYYYGSMTPNIMQFSPDGDWLAIGDWEGNLSVLSSRLFVELLDPEFSWETYQPPDDYYNSQLEWQLAGNTAEISGLAFSSDGRWFASSDYDGSLILWSVPEFNFSKNLKSVSNADAISFSPANNYLAAGYVDGSINVIDPSTGEVVKTLWGATSSVSNVAYSPDGSILASASYEGAIALWDVESGEVLRLLEGHRGWVHALQFSPDGSLLISSSADGTVRLWGVR
jgi:WD40 repeat protein